MNDLTNGEIIYDVVNENNGQLTVQYIFYEGISKKFFQNPFWLSDVSLGVYD